MRVWNRKSGRPAREQVRNGKNLKKEVGRREEEKAKFRCWRWNQPIMEIKCVKEGEKESRIVFAWVTSTVLHSETPKVILVYLDEDRWLNFKHFDFEVPLGYPRGSLSK